MTLSTRLNENPSLTKSDKWQLTGVILFMLIYSTCILKSSSYHTRLPVATIKLNHSKTWEFDKLYLTIENTISNEGLKSKIGLDSTHQMLIIYPLVHNYHLFTCFSERIVQLAIDSSNNQNIEGIEIRSYY
ncbi:MAG: hypothetical protein CMB80_11070 [Flammeovirgaceae bacterium]|nr:hypothetical protein [Flammeovirgaceae bacterium]MBE61257.1 hypothetical protein [Flammeovirgaceae bacterium]MBR11166.1 hypothetical protein [Rickettsiales bacterium]